MGYGLEHGLYVSRRLGDYVQYLAGRRLVFQRVLQLPFACLLSLEQPRVLDSDYGLVGEGFDELDFLAVEGPCRSPANSHDTLRGRITQQRNRQHGAIVAEGQGTVSILRVLRRVGYVDSLTRACGTRRDRA